jgi:hypothetical protein
LACLKLSICQTPEVLDYVIQLGFEIMKLQKLGLSARDVAARQVGVENCPRATLQLTTTVKAKRQIDERERGTPM